MALPMQSITVSFVLPPNVANGPRCLAGLLLWYSFYCLFQDPRSAESYAASVEVFISFRLADGMRAAAALKAELERIGGACGSNFKLYRACL